MRNKRVIFILGFLVVVVGAAAFVGGRMLNQGVNPLGLIPFVGRGEFVSVSVKIDPAPELPTTQPVITGPFAERKDNSIVVSSVSMKTGGGGVVVGGPGAELEEGPRVEVVITNETIIYRETTEFGDKPPAENETIQQTVAEGTLDDLTAQSFVTVWGRKSGDRVIAEVVFISNPVVIKRQGP